MTRHQARTIMIQQAAKTDLRTRLETERWLEARISQESGASAEKEARVDEAEWDTLKESARTVKVVVGALPLMGKRRFSQLDGKVLRKESERPSRSRSRSRML